MFLKFLMPVRNWKKKNNLKIICLFLSGKSTGCFEWIDGLLIEALQSGAWLLIDNVNFCTPTVKKIKYLKSMKFFKF